jgi:NAD(P)-dependent dehydrogenase (short-subunit alcohol dehydrogenase family)
MTDRPQQALFDLTGKLALVIGASRGIGRACAHGLASAGADLAVSGRDREELAILADELRQEDRVATAHMVDVQRAETIPPLVEEVLNRHDRIDILLYSAGTNVQQPALLVSDEDWDVVLDTNLRGAFFAMREVGRSMVERRSGKIIAIASTFSMVGFPNRAAYAASKGGLLQLTRTLAIEWAAYGVNVNAVGPTATRTRMNEALFDDPDWRRDVLARIPAGRFCEPADVVGAVVFLASPASSMVNGHLLMVDGGWTAI